MAFLQDYEKIEQIGKGSFAAIWKVKHRTLGYIRAIKVSNEMIDSENDPAYQTFLNECKVLLKIGNGSHPNIVHIYQPRLIENRAIVEMDYVDGETLANYIERVKFVPIDEVHRFFKEIVGALAYCHHDIYKFLMDPNEDDLTSDPNNGHHFLIDEATKRRLVEKYSITHNDLHSNNVMRRSYDGSFILLDFGLAIQDGNCVKSSSRTGGALEYMSPEKFNNQNLITKQSDIYSLGILLYEVLAGRVPFEMDPSLLSSNPTVAQYQIMNKHQQDTPPSIESLRREAFENANPGAAYTKDYPDWMEAMILKCLEKNPANRYSDAKELFDDYKAKVETNTTKEKVRFVPRTKPQPTTNGTIPPPIIPPSQGPTGQETEKNGKDKDGSSKKTGKSNKGLIAFIIILVVTLLTVGGIIAYKSYQESLLPRYYTYTTLRLRSTDDTLSTDNIITSLPYGTKLLMLDLGHKWSHVKAVTDNGKQEGYVSSDYILDESDYYLLDGIFGNDEAREAVSESRYRKALIKYFKQNNYRGYLSPEAYKNIGLDQHSDSREMWQLFCYPKSNSTNSVVFCKEFNKASKNNDMVAVFTNGNINGMYKLVYFYFDDQNKPYVVHEENPASDRIKYVSVGKSWWTGEKTFYIDYE